jgi:HAE1 family hydrophobic/amphiphilic exporter-1
MLLPEDNAGHMASGLTELSLRRRIGVLVLLLALIVVGVIATVGIPVELFPRGYTGQNLMVFVPWQNAPSQEVLDKITLPLEEELSTVKGLDGLNSYSTLGGGNVFLRFKQGTDMDVAYREVRDRVQRARALFPDDADRVFIRKEDASGIPVVVFGLVIDPSLIDYYTLLKKEVIQPLERIDGVATVRANGLEEKEIIIEVDRSRAEAQGLNLYELAQGLAGDNFSMASGNVRDQGRKFLLRSTATYRSLEELEQRPVTPTVRLKDVARIKYEEPEKRYSVRVNSRPAVAIVVLKEGEANTVAVSRRIQAAFEAMQKNPRLAGIEMESMFNQGKVVEESLLNLARSGLIGGSFAAAILFFFLGRVRLTAIVTLSMPLSMLIALTAMFFTGESLNVLTILALVIAIGMVVDNSIVVAENIHRLHGEGWSRRDACIRGAGEIALAITLATLTTIVVFVPVALVEGQGQFFLMRLALPVSVALTGSLFVALVFVPLSVFVTLPAQGIHQQHSLLRRLHRVMEAGLHRLYDNTLEAVNHHYNHWLAACLRHRFDAVLLLVLALGGSAWLAFEKLHVVDQQEEDQNSFQLSVEASNEYSFEEVGDYFRQIERVLEQKKAAYGLKGYFTFYRPRGGSIEGWFDPEQPQAIPAKKVAEQLLKEFPRRPGIKIFYGRENQAEEAKGREIFVLRLEGDDATVLEEVGDRLEPVLSQIPGVLGLRKGEELAPSEMALVIDRDRASASSVNPEVIAGLVGYALRGSSLPKFNDRGREIPVRVRFDQRDRESLSDLTGFAVPSALGDTVPLSSLTTPKILSTPKGIFRSNKRITRIFTIELKRETAGETRQALFALQREWNLPEGVTFGTSQVATLSEDLKNMTFAGALSVVFIYLLMGFLFESFILPLSIILTIPLAGIGVVWAHYLTGKDLDFLGVVAVVLLVGVVVNNGIVLIDYVIRLRQEGQSRSDALLHAADRRFRPILMTALTTIVGMVPLTVSRPTEIGLSYKSFGLTLIGGMTTATLLTLLVVPVFYALFDDAREAVSATLRSALQRWSARRTS